MGERSQLIPTATSARVTPYAWYVIFLLAMVNTVNYMDRMAFAMLAPFIQADLHLSDAQIGSLAGLAFALFYAICGVPIAYAADRGVRRDIIAIALTVWSAVTALSGAAQNFMHLLLARVGVGIGEAGSFSPGASIICDYVPLGRRPGALALHAWGNTAGIFAGMALAGWLAVLVGWRGTFVLFGVSGITLAIVVRMTLREPRRGGADAKEAPKDKVSFRTTLGFLWRCRTFRLLTLANVGSAFFQYGVIQWWPTFYTRMFEANPSVLGAYLGIAIGGGTGIGMLAGGFVADAAGRRDVRLPLKMGGIAAILAPPLVLTALFAPSLPVSIALVLLSGLLAGVCGGPVSAAVFSVVDARMRATAGAVSVFCLSVLGFGLGPLCVGVLSDLLAPAYGDQSLRYAMLLSICVAPVWVIAMFAAAKTLPHDLRVIAMQSGAQSPVTKTE